MAAPNINARGPIIEMEISLPRKSHTWFKINRFYLKFQFER